METRAIVFIYTGETASPQALGSMIASLNDHIKISGDVEVNCFTRDEIAKMCINAIQKKQVDNPNGYTKEEWAFIYLAKKLTFAEKWPFRLFCKRVTDILDYKDENTTKSLKILGESHHLNIRKELLEKYEFLGCASQIGFLKTLGRNV